MKIASLIENNPGLADGQAYAAILGLTPSRGARSPILWNAAFEAFGRSERMVALDILPENLEKVLEGLAADASFIGGAVTMPYKEKIADWLGPSRLEPQAEKIGAINCLYRDANGDLRGANTDGEAALLVLQAALTDLDRRHALLMGPGGAGKSVAAYLADSAASLTVAARNPGTAGTFCNRLGAALIPFQEVKRSLDRYDLIVNCTPLGFSHSDPTTSPINQSDAALLRPATFVFDIIYSPLCTPLLDMARSRGLNTENGLQMNRLQAVQAFVKATGISDAVKVQIAMKSV